MLTPLYPHAASNTHTYNPLFFSLQRAKADADAEKQIALVNAKEKMAEEYDRKEKLLAVDLKMCVHSVPPRGSPTR
jgi:hypothetical protein